MSADQPTWHVEVVEETGSTNADLVARAATGAPDRTVLRARFQSAGRGRLDRRWDAPPGTNLLVSMLFRGSWDQVHRWTRLVAVGACRAVQAVTGRRADLKWPNDVLLDGAKLAGILAEAGQDAGGGPFTVVGLGLNVGWAPDGAARLGDGLDPALVLGALLAAIDDLEAAERTTPGALDVEYRHLLATLGQRVQVTLPGGTVEGRAVELDDGGRLVVETADGSISVEVGDVVHLRPVAD